MPEQNQPERIPIVQLTAVLAPTGLSINLRSAVFEDFFAAQPGSRANVQREMYGGARYYESDTRFDDFTSGDISNWGSRQLITNGRPNISILRAVGIRDGVDITIQTVLNKRQMGQYLEAFEEAAVEFYAQYIRTERYELTITAQHVTERD